MTRRTVSAAWLCVLALCGCSRSTHSSPRGVDPGQNPAASVESSAAAPRADANASAVRRDANASAVRQDAKLPLERVRLPKGFRIAAYATDVENARSLALSPAAAGSCLGVTLHPARVEALDGGP